MVADTQDNRSVVGIFAMDVNDNLYMIEAKEVQYLILTDEERFKVNETNRHLAEENGSTYTEIETAEDMLKKAYLKENRSRYNPDLCFDRPSGT